MPQNEITDSPLRELPDITEKDLQFVLCIYEGMSQSDAYRQIFAGPDTKNSTIWCEASKKASSPNVAQWLDYIKLGRLKAAEYSIDSHLRELDELRLLSIKSGNMGAAVNATVNKGKARGLYVERVQDVTPTPDEILAAVRTLLGDDIAERLGENLH